MKKNIFLEKNLFNEFFKKKSPAQGTIEYLIIISVVIVVSLVVVGMSIGVFGTSSTQISTSSNSLGSLVSAKINVFEVVADDSGQGVVSLLNNTGESLTIKRISSVGSSLNKKDTFFNMFCTSGAKTSFLVENLDTYCDCASLEGKKECSFDIGYISYSGIEKTNQVKTVVECISELNYSEAVVQPSLYCPYAYFVKSSPYGLVQVNLETESATVIPLPFEPRHVAVDSENNAWVTNNNSASVYKITPAGSILGPFAINTISEGIAVDATDNIWVSNSRYGTGNNTISRLNSSGSLIGSYSTGSSPYGVAIDSNNNVWVANYSSNTISRFNANNVSSPFVANYSLSYCSGPFSVAVDNSNYVYVSCASSGKKVARIRSTDGNIIYFNDFLSNTASYALTVDSSGNIWASGGSNQNFLKFDSNGNIIATYAGLAQQAYGISFDGRGNIWGNSFSSITKIAADGTVTTPFTTYTQSIGYGDRTGFALQYFVMGRR